MKALAVLALLPLLGCIRDDRAQRDRGASGFLENTQTIRAPGKGRCDGLGSGAAGRRCAEAKYLGEIYVRKLDVGTDVCVEGGFGDEPTGACLARAAVVDTATDRILLEIRGAKPDSRWFHKEQNQFWFEEGALVDLYLADHGY
jgi:hypothetical protein